MVDSALDHGTGPLDCLALPRLVYGSFGGWGSHKTHNKETNTVYRIEVHVLLKSSACAMRCLSSPLSIISLGDVGGGGGVTDRELQESPSKFQCD